MKNLLALLVIALATSAAPAQSAAETAEAYYKKGLAAERAGDPVTARAAYAAALKYRPGHAKARYRAGQVKINAKSLKSKARKTKIGAVMIPVYQIEEASLSEAIDLLRLAIDKQTDGKIAPNFIIEDSKDKLAGKSLTMNLKNVPAKAILKYLLDQTGAKARYDEHAVVIIAR